jgi:aminocarboxymuconate-semialdehyde decarboxylase
MLYKCGHTAHAPATDFGQAPGAAKGGKSYFTVDLHCHLHVLEADAMLEGVEPGGQPYSAEATNALTAEINRRQQVTIATKLTDPVERIADMDATGVDVQAVSPAPSHYYYAYEAGAARDAARVVNDRIAEVVGQHPDRFVGLCTVPLQDVDIAVAELERSVDQLGLRGVEISTNVNGVDLTRAGLERFFQRVEELGVVIFMHPLGTSFRDRLYDHYFQNTIGHPFESALAVGHLVFDGYLEKFPELKIVIAHGGGYIPAYLGRFDHPYHLRDDLKVVITKPPSEYVKKLYFDTVVFTHHQLEYLVGTWGADHVVMGTDYPYDMMEVEPVRFVDSAPGLSEDQKRAVVGGNAAALLGIEVSAPS